MTHLRSLFMFSAFSFVCAPATAQVTSHVDEEGRRVYINAEPQVKMVKAAMRSVAVRTLSDGTQVSVDSLRRIADEAADRHQIDPALVHAMIETESDWNPRAVSSKGAQGLMQLMPATAVELGVRDPFDPQQNIDGGVRHLRKLLERFAGDLDRTLAAYNAGRGAVERAGGVPNYPETREYIRKVTDTYFGPGSGRQPSWWTVSKKVYQVVDSKGKRVFTNE